MCRLGRTVASWGGLLLTDDYGSLRRDEVRMMPRFRREARLRERRTGRTMSDLSDGSAENDGVA